MGHIFHWPIGTCKPLLSRTPCLPHCRAVLIGEQTFGKGVVQHFFPFEDGSGIKVTVEKYLTPHRHDISREGGINPDVSCNDYPHTGAVSADNDSCIQLALRSLQ